MTIIGTNVYSRHEKESHCHFIRTHIKYNMTKNFVDLLFNIFQVYFVLLMNVLKPILCQIMFLPVADSAQT